MPRIVLWLTLCALSGVAFADDVKIGAHPAKFDSHGHLLPWTSWRDALTRELLFYRQSPGDNGYPRFVAETFLQGDWTPDPHRDDTIPATQNGMGIISYVKSAAWRHDDDDLRVAREMADYLIRETLTPDAGEYPRFPHSTGRRGQFPLAADSGSQSDRPFEIEPDKGGIVGYALLMLDDSSHQAKYFDEALHIARVLAAHQRPGDDRRSPWPFRVDHRTGESRGEISGDMTYILRLYDGLLRRGHPEFVEPRRALWTWIARHQIPSAKGDGRLFAQFFEDHDSPDNLTAWSPLNLARYLLERRGALDSSWRADAGTLIAFVRHRFTHRQSGVIVCHEQDEDTEAWGGVNSTYGAVLAMYASAIGSSRLADEARQSLNYALYAIDDEGRPRDLPSHDAAGGWQEDAHTDVIHNVIDAMHAFPRWETAN